MFNEIYAMQFEKLIQIKGKISVTYCLNNSYRSRERATISMWPAGIMAFKNMLYPHQIFFGLPDSRTICLDGRMPIEKNLVELFPLGRDARYQ